MGIVTRTYGPNAKGAKLTTKEMDENLIYLNDEIVIAKGISGNVRTLTLSSLASSTSERIFYNNAAPVTYTLPLSPATNTVYEIIDANGNADTHNITIDGNGKNIQGAATKTISSDYETIKLVYNGTQYNII